MRKDFIPLSNENHCKEQSENEYIKVLNDMGVIFSILHLFFQLYKSINITQRERESNICLIVYAIQILHDAVFE